MFQNADQNVKDLIECLILGNPIGQKYPESVRAFALTLHFHSPRAYEYVRQRFNGNLPSSSTLKAWYSLSKSAGKPGMCHDALNVLKSKADSMIANGQQLLCTISFDEMAIRKHVQWSDPEKRFFGRISFGSRTNQNDFEVAKNAIVFMVNGLNEDFNLPVAFHFIRELNGAERAELLTKVVSNITSLNIKIKGVIFDGLSANITMCKLLGAGFIRNDFRPYITLPNTTDKMYVFLDPSHMLKLVRNTLGRLKVLFDDKDQKIEWRYFEELERFRSEKGYILTHKLTKKHIQWYRNPMRVHLATETLSNSVADSMESLMLMGKTEFANCAATIRFIRYFNRIFDALNSKVFTKSKFKTPITTINHSRFFTFFDEAIEYIKSLQIKPEGNLLLFSKNRTAFRGLITDMVNTRNVYFELVGSSMMQNLPTFKFSQDPLEGLFGRIRSLNGYNDNPTVQQFCAAFRKVTVNTEIVCGSFSNCVDSLNILTVSSNNSKTIETDCSNTPFGVLDYLEYVEELEHQHSEVQQIQNCDAMLDSLENCSIAYIAGSIEQKIQNCEADGRFSCDACKLVFSSNDKLNILFYPEGKYIPCKSSFDICALTDKHLKACMFELNFDYKTLLNSILRDISYVNLYQKTNFADHVHHKYYIVEFIVEEFIRIQANYTAKQATLNEQSKLLRSKLKKIIHNLGQ